MAMKPKFFPSPPHWHAWLAEHHLGHEELWVGFYKKASGKPSITWPEAVDGALCFGWIDGVRKSLDEASYVIRFTPRRSHSVWSAVNIRRVAELMKLGLMQPRGVQAFEKRTGSGPKSMLTSSEWAPGSAMGTRRGFAPTRKPGSFSRRSHPCIEGLPVGT